MAESKASTPKVQTMKQLLKVVDDAIASNTPTSIELSGGRRVSISPEPQSLAVPADGVQFTPAEVARRLAVIRSLFGAWSGIDGEAWKKQIKEERGSDRAVVDFDR
jgi:hypothetical protein